MFHASLDAQTALASTPRSARALTHATLAVFEVRRETIVLDLTRLPGLIDASRHVDDQPVAFLSDFARELTRPIDYDVPDQLEYVPTQVMTEFVRCGFGYHIGRRLGGMLYHGHGGQGVNLVLFLAREDYVDDVGRQTRRPPIRLLTRETRTLPLAAIARE
jgi:hypothetical protein